MERSDHRRRARKPSGNSSPSPADSDQIHDLNKQIDRLQRDLARREKELYEERQENESGIERVRKLERDRHELKRELDDVRDEVVEYQRLVEELQEELNDYKNRQSTIGTDGDKQRDEDDDPNAGFKLVLQEKNREITQLVEDLEKIEEEKEALKYRLRDVSESLQEATNEIELFVRERLDFKAKLQKAEEKIKNLEEDKFVLEIRERDLLAFKERHDSYLENLCTAVDVRVDVWKKLMQEKDNEIDRLNGKIGELVVQIPCAQAFDADRITIVQLNEKLKEREEQIQLLTDQLYQATEDINSQAKKIETLKSQSHHEHGPSHHKSHHDRSPNRKQNDASLISKLQVKVDKQAHLIHTLEKELEEKSGEIIHLNTRLSGLENGIYGLPESVAEIKELRSQLGIRNKEIENLTSELNHVHIIRSELLDENELLRSKLSGGKHGGHHILPDLSMETKKYAEARTKELKAYKNRVDILENEIVNLKTRNYNLRKLLGQGATAIPHEQESPIGDIDGTTTNEVQEWRSKYDTILNENTDLRKGFAEILESLQRLSEEGTSTVTVESPILENLLREMSARGLINYPYSISAFHLKVCNLEGKNSQLREELNRLRQNERQLNTELIDAKSRVKILEDKLRSIGASNPSLITSLPPAPPRPAPRRSKSKSPERSQQRIRFDDQSRPGSAEQRETIEDPLLSQAREEMMQRIQPHSFPLISDLQNEIQELRDENNNLRSNHALEKSKLEDRLRILVEKGNQLFEDDSVNPNEITNRKFVYLKTLRDQQISEINFLHMRLTEIENKNTHRINSLETFREKALQQIVSFQVILESSAPLSLLYSTKKELLDLSHKYQVLRHKSEAMSLELVNRENMEAQVAKLENKIYNLEHELAHYRASTDSLRSTDTNQSECKYHDLHDKTKELEAQLQLLTAKNIELGYRERELELNLSNSVPRADYDLLSDRTLHLQSEIISTKEEITKWKEIAELSQTQICAMENIKDFERIEIESLVSQVTDLQAESIDKSELARVKQELVTTEKEKILALQQVQKLISKLTSAESQQLQADRTFSDRELLLLTSQTQVINRYRNMFISLYEFSIMIPKTNLSPVRDVVEAWNLVKELQEKVRMLERKLVMVEEEADEWKEKGRSLEELLNAIRAGNQGELNMDYAQKIQESRVELTRWKRRAEQAQRMVEILYENLAKVESQTGELEEDRARLEHSLELKESLASSLQQLPKLDLSSPFYHPVYRAASTTQFPKVPVTLEQFTQTEIEVLEDSSIEQQLEDCSKLQAEIDSLNKKLIEMSNILQAKDQVINDFKLFSSERYSGRNSGSNPNEENELTRKTSSALSFELNESLIVAQETITSLNDRIKAKDENLNQYKKLLAEVRNEMVSTTERHVEEMKALQVTIFQQQQAFTRMKSTLSHPVQDNADIESTIREQLTRINELEEEVSELQHALGNVASQLTSARSDAHRWRSTADSRLKELDLVRDQIMSENIEEMSALRAKVQHQQEVLQDMQRRSNELPGSAESKSDSNSVTMLKRMLEERDKQIEAMKTSAGLLLQPRKVSDKNLLESRDKEIENLRDGNKELQQKISALQVKVSRLNALNQKSGVSSELEELKTKYKTICDEKENLSKRLEEIEKNVVQESEKQRKTIDGFARWEESKKWKKQIERLEHKLKDAEGEKAKLFKSVESLRTTVTRLEKERTILESRLKCKSVSGSTPTTSTTANEKEAAELMGKISDLQELVEKTEFEGREEVEKLRMEIRILKERILSQERQLASYQITSTKASNEIASEIEKMATVEDTLQKQIISVEEENLHLKLQIEQLRLETPRLRERCVHLQKLVDLLKSDKSAGKSGSVRFPPERATSQKSLGELEKTIRDLNSVIEKLQSDKKRSHKLSSTTVGSRSSMPKAAASDKLRETLESLMSEKEQLLDQIANLEDENSKYQNLYLDLNANVEVVQTQLTEAEKRAKSAESKLKIFLEQSGPMDTIEQQLQTLREEVSRKDRLLSEAKHALQVAAEANKKQQPSSSSSTKLTNQ